MTETLEEQLAAAKAALAEAEGLAEAEAAKVADERAKIQRAHNDADDAVEEAREAAKAAAEACYPDDLEDIVRQWSGATPEDVGAEALRVPGHDLLAQAVEIAQVWIRGQDPGFQRALAYMQALEAERRDLREQLHKLDRPTRKAKNDAMHARWSIERLEREIVERDNKVAEKTPERKEAKKRQKLARAELRELGAGSHRNYRAAKRKPDLPASLRKLLEARRG